MAKISSSRGKSSTKVSEDTNNVTMDVAEEETPVQDTGVTIEGLEEQEKKTVAPIPPKSVKIKMAMSHRCNIGGTVYNLEKGKTYVVPENVKHILSKSGLLLPL